MLKGHGRAAGKGGTLVVEVKRRPDTTDVLVQRQDYWARLTINRPRMSNAADMATWQMIGAEVARLAQDPDLQVLFVTGAGERAFCTGADLDEQKQFLQRPRDYWKWMGDFIEVHERLRNLGKPVVARLNGIVVGGGVPTINLRIDYLRPAVGDALTGTARVRRAGRTVALVDVDVYDEQQNLVAVGRGTYSGQRG